ncbi:MAG: ATP-binding protein [Rhodospirillaceae bacterium]
MARALLRIINDILDMSKLKAGKVELEYLDMHLPSLVSEVMGMFAEKRQGGRSSLVEVVTDLADDLPAAIHCDPTRLRQVLINLVGNARKFTEKGSITVSGRLVGDDPRRPMLRFAVADTGIGIKPEVVGELFSEFTQGDVSITRKYEGTGLGLSICKKLVSLMDGNIGVDSVYGKSSTFWFTLPFVPAKGPVSADGEREQAVSNYVAARPLHILVVDDNGLNRQIITSVLAAIGHSFDTAENGMQAVEKH